MTASRYLLDSDIKPGNGPNARSQPLRRLGVDQGRRDPVSHGYRRSRSARWGCCMVLLLAQLTLLASPAEAAPWAEGPGDAPELPPGQEPFGTGPLDSISGTISPNTGLFGTDIDLYKICLDGGQTFSANTDNAATTADTYLSLFDKDGKGVYAQRSSQTTRAILPAGVGTLSPSAAGQYYLGVSTSDLAPLDAAGRHVFIHPATPVESPNPAASPVAAWVIGRLLGGSYRVDLTGARFCEPQADASATGPCTRTLTGALGPVVAIYGTTCVRSARVTGDILVVPGAALSLQGSVVQGSITADRPSALTICGSLVTGSVAVVGATGFVLIGDGGDGPIPGCPGGVFRDDVVLDSNTRGVEFGGNSAARDVLVVDNVAPGSGLPIENNATEIERNAIGGAIVCFDNVPAPTNDGRPNLGGTRLGQCAPAPF